MSSLSPLGPINTPREGQKVQKKSLSWIWSNTEGKWLWWKKYWMGLTFYSICMEITETLRKDNQAWQKAAARLWSRIPFLICHCLGVQLGGYKKAFLDYDREVNSIICQATDGRKHYQHILGSYRVRPLGGQKVRPTAEISEGAFSSGGLLHP